MTSQAMKRPIGETYRDEKRFCWMVHRLAETSKEQDEASEHGHCEKKEEED